MNNVLRLALNDLRLTVRDRPAFLWMLALPVAMMWFFGQIGGGSSGPPKVALAVVDRDGGWLARALADDLASERFEIRSIAPADLETAKDKVRTLAIPEGFTQKVLAGEQQALRLEKEPGSSETAGLAAQAHVTRAIGRTLSRLVEMGVGNEEPASLSPEAALERLREMSSRPLLVKLEVSSAGRGRPVPSGRSS